jgi:hypothetical protein
MMLLLFVINQAAFLVHKGMLKKKNGSWNENVFNFSHIKYNTIIHTIYMRQFFPLWGAVEQSPLLLRPLLAYCTSYI